MKLENIQEYVREKGWECQYTEEDGCGSVDFSYRGISYHVWEFPDGEGAESNVKDGGKQEDFLGYNYEEDILAVIKSWK